MQADSSGLDCVWNQSLSGKVFGVQGGNIPVRDKLQQVQFTLSVQDRDKLTPFDLAQFRVKNHVVLKVLGSPM